MMDDIIFETFPLGYRFQPDDHECVVRYLCNKVNYGDNYHFSEIFEHDLYSEDESWKKVFVERKKDDFIYFYTKLKKKKDENGSRIERRTGASATWKAQSDKQIRSLDGTHLGSKRIFSYYQRGPRPQPPTKRERWVMHEYRLDGILKTFINDEGYVLCMIKREE